MRPFVALTCLLGLATGCAVWQPAQKHRDPPLLHGYNEFTMHPQDVKNLNRDPDGEPWMIGGLILPTDEELAVVPRLSMASTPRYLRLPERVNNSTQKYWRGIFSQKHGSCAQASGIAYVYTYEVNRIRKKNANNPHDRYPTHWTYNFVNKGYDRGSWMMWGWEVGKSLGIPNVKLYGTETGFDLQYWPSEYTVYENAMDNRIDHYWVLDAGSESGLTVLKRYLHNHGSEGGEGGIVSFAAGWSTGYAEAKVADGQYEAGKLLIASFGASVNHAITFVGYDDKVCYDYSGDGECTNDQDVNGDERVDLKDWEVGAFIMANSWGTGWGDGGFIYVPYRLIAYSPADGGIYRSSVYGVVPKHDEPKGMAMRVVMQHSDRSKLKFLSSMSTRTDESEDKFYRYYGLQSSGGSYPLNGKTNDPVEMGLDLRRLVGQTPEEQLVSLSLVLDSTGGIGNIAEMEVVDYATGKVVESQEQDIEIVRGRTLAEADWNEDDDPDPDPEPVSCSVGPVALAGYNLVVNEHCTLVIDGSDSFDIDDGEIVKYRWRQQYGPQKLQLEGADTSKVTVYVPKVEKNETYWLLLTVTDDDDFSDSDRVRLKVRNR